MASILFAWELGGGSGHCVNLLPIIKGLLARGHDVSLAMRDLHMAHRVFGSLDVTYFQAPILREPPNNPVRRPQNFADILHNIGFGDSTQLDPLVSAWLKLFEVASAKLVVAEHSPTALLAARVGDVRTAVVGTGFFSPPDLTPLPGFLSLSLQTVSLVESQILGRVNRHLQESNHPLLNRVSQLYAEVDENFLLTFAELDHYPQRVGATYWGMNSPAGGVAPSWDKNASQRLFAYLQPPIYSWTPKTILRVLSDLEIETLVYVPAVASDLIRDFRVPHIHFETRRLDMAQVCEECTAAITHGNNGTVTQLLRGGVPLLLVPIFLEQVVFSRRVENTGAGLIAAPDQPDQVAVNLTTLLTDNRPRRAAAQFAERYRDFDSQASFAEIVRRLDRLLMKPAV